MSTACQILNPDGHGKHDDFKAGCLLTYFAKRRKTMTDQNAAPGWLEAVLDKLNPPADTILTDPADTKKALSNLNMAGCRFQHEDGEVRMAVYTPCVDPDTKEPVGMAVIFLGDDARLYRRAKSVQGVHLEEAAQELLGDYMQTFNRPGAESSAGDKATVKALWEADDYEITSTGGGCWAAMKVVGNVEFWLTDYDESASPNPHQPLIVGAYVPNSGIWLEFTKDVANKAEADSNLAKWAEELKLNLERALEDESEAAPAPSKPTAGMAP